MSTIDLGKQMLTGVVAIGFFPDDVLKAECRRRGFELASTVAQRLASVESQLAEARREVERLRSRAEMAERDNARLTTEHERMSLRSQERGDEVSALRERLEQMRARAEKLLRLAEREVRP